MSTLFKTTKLTPYQTFILVIFVMVFSICLVNVGYTQNSNENLRDAHKRLDNLRKKFDKSNQQSKNLTRNISNLQKERKELTRHIILSGARVRELESTLTLIEKKLSKLSREEKAIRRTMAKRHGKIATILSIMQRMGRQPPPIIATHRDDALKMVRSAMLLSAVLPKLKQEIAVLSNDLTRLVSVISEGRREYLSLRKRRNERAAEHKRLKRLQNSKKTRILSQKNELKIVNAARDTYIRNTKHIQSLMAKMDREVTRSTRLGRYQKKLASGNTGESRIDPKTGKKINLVPKKGDTNVEKTGRVEPRIAFFKAQGLLPLPASGVKIKNFGDVNEYGTKSQGMWLGTRNNALVVAPSDGWVIFHGKFRSYGQLLIINAGGGYHILLAGLGKIDVQVGQFVVSGEPVGTMGSQKKRSLDKNADFEQSLYIEFQKNQRPIDPNPWWIIRQAGRKAQG